MSTQKEANARLKINKLLEKSGWRLVDDQHGQANVSVENYLVADSGDALGLWVMILKK